MASSASLDVGCGTYSIKVNSPDPDQVVCQVDPAFFDGQTESTFTLDNANDAIGKFCTDDKALVSNPKQPEPFLQDKFTDTTPYPWRYYLYGDVVIQISVAFVDTVIQADLSGCGPDKQFQVKDYSDRCKELLGKAVNGCKLHTHYALRRERYA